MEHSFTLEQASVNTLRALGCEAISNAKSGHSGMVLSAAPMMYSIYKAMKFDPKNGSWFNRDRFVLSAGHGSALLYATLKSFGFEGLDLKTFRQINSKLTGHPELNTAIGVDCSTGPLGQGIAMAVGIALAEKRLAEKYNRAVTVTYEPETIDGQTVQKPDRVKQLNIIDHRTFCLVGDGCLMEGASYEACNLAAKWELNKLIVLYDCNGATLDGTRESADGEDVAKRFRAMGWRVLRAEQGNDELQISLRIRRAVTSKHAPTIIICNTTIGYGSKDEGSHKAHGSVLSADEITNMREKWEITKTPFGVDADVAGHFNEIVNTKNGSAKKWFRLLKKYGTVYPNEYADVLEFVTATSHNLKLLGKKIKHEPTKFVLDANSLAEIKSGRDQGHEVLNQIAVQTPRVIGGSADLASTTKAFLRETANISYGVREFAMGAISNGLALHGFTPFCSTFLAFSDYCRAAIRLTALMNLPVTYIFTHDGIGNPPDGATHQCAEHIAALRVIPNLNVYRPADVTEVCAVYEYVFEAEQPAAIILSRGDLPTSNIKNVDDPAAILIASGAEVNLCARAQKLLGGLGIFVNVISVPCLEQFNHRELKFNANKTVILAVEMGVGTHWWALFGHLGLKHCDVLAFDTHGHSGTEADVREKIGFTPEHVADKVLSMLEKHHHKK
jgi:transketolase